MTDDSTAETRREEQPPNTLRQIVVEEIDESCASLAELVGIPAMFALGGFIGYHLYGQAGIFFGALAGYMVFNYIMEQRRHRELKNGIPPECR